MTITNFKLAFISLLIVFGTAKSMSRPLIIVHASTEFDSTQMARKEIGQIVSDHTKNSAAVYYLMNDLSPQGFANWYAPTKPQAYKIIYSEGGEHNLDLAKESGVTIAGGYFGSYDGARGCLTLATRDAIRMHFEKSESPFNVYWPVKGIYFYDEDIGFRRKLISKIEKKEYTNLDKFFENFENNFLLVDNFSSEIEFSHPYISRNPKNINYRYGKPVSINSYKFHIYVNNVFVKTFGKGTKTVNLIFE